MNDKKFENVLSGKSFWYKEIIFGIIFLIIVFVGSAQVDKKAAESQVNSTISYVKTQYILGYCTDSLDIRKIQ